ncbi:MAG: serine/threonine-protein kinase, partial [Myxococcota bacterium]
LKRRRFSREVQALAGLDHPYIITVFDHGVVTPDTARCSEGALEPGSLYLVMELAEGAFSRSSAPQDWVGLRSVLIPLLEALAHAHARSVIHRDIKPGNVLVTRDLNGAQQLKLTDFGIAFAMDDPSAREDEEVRVVGSVRYMAPEQLLGHWRDQGPWTDLYALGCMAYQLLTGKPPFGHPQSPPREVAQQHLRHPVPRPQNRFPTPIGFERWLGTLLAKTPEQRFRMAADALEALKALDAPAIPDAQVSLFTSASLTPSSPQFPAWHSTRDLSAIATPSGVGLGLYGLRSIPVVGRDAEKRVLWDTLRQVCA